MSEVYWNLSSRTKRHLRNSFFPKHFLRSSSMSWTIHSVPVHPTGKQGIHAGFTRQSQKTSSGLTSQCSHEILPSNTQYNEKLSTRSYISERKGDTNFSKFVFHIRVQATCIMSCKRMYSKGTR